MSSNVLIESQLASLAGLTASYRADLHRKEEELQRLQDALTDLGDNKSDFLESKTKCLKPECTSNTLHGDNEEDLDDFREGTLRKSFLAIPNEDISDAEETIQEKIEQLKQEIKSLESTIAGLETQQSVLSAKKTEVKNDS